MDVAVEVNINKKVDEAKEDDVKKYMENVEEMKELLTMKFIKFSNLNRY